jgi:D-3-phosphoglycerate dehydrogenase / 2-oxoglutarate reductase
MNSYRVLVTDNLSAKGVEILQRTPGIETVVDNEITADGLRKSLKDFDALVVRSRTKLTADLIEAAERLKVVGRAGTGLDNIDLEAATKRGIAVMNTPGGNTVTTAEHAISLLLSLTRNVPQASASIKTGKWEKKKFQGRELANKTLGVLGMGKVGAVVADRAKGLKMHVIAYDPYLSVETAQKKGVEAVSFDALLCRSDYVTIHVPLNDSTHHLVGAEAFSKMKDGVMLVHCARGGIVDEQALLEALKSGKVAGDALDVFETEPPGQSPLIALDNVICTPHLGASTTEAQENVAVAVAEQIVDFLLRGLIRNAVNVPSVSKESLAVLRPYIRLCEKMGNLYSQMSPGPIDEVRAEYSGELADHDTRPLTLALLKGLLEPMREVETVNYVNAPLIAEERGIRVSEAKTRQDVNFTNKVSIQFCSGSKENCLVGAVFGNQGPPRLVRMNQYYVEAILEGNILVMENLDKPGTIGAIGVLLGQNHINIAGFHLGRDQQGGQAVAFINVDAPVPREVLEEASRLPNILSVRQITLG